MREDATVLVIDDDLSFAHTLKSVLEAKGYPAIETHDGQSALQIIKGEGVAVAIIDFQLDDMPGIDVLRKIKHRSPATECIMLTGHANSEIVIEAINMGVFGFLQKPCDMDQLLVTVRRAVEKRDSVEALRESEQHTRAILHSSLDAVVTIDELGTVIDWNPQAEKTLGWRRREALGKAFFDLLFRSEDEALRRAWGAPAEISLLNRPVEATVRHKEGHEVLVEWVVTNVEMVGRRTFSFFIRDITRRRRLEQQFMEAQRIGAVDLLAGGVLHDFNNVLTAILGQAALMRQNTALAETDRDTAQGILDAAQRASGLARQLLAYSRPQKRQPELTEINPVIIDLSRLLKRVLGENIDLRKDLASDLRPVEIDRYELEQMIINLVLNARDAMPDGGVLSIETANVDAGEARPSRPLGEENDTVTLTVRDYGVGMDKTTLIRAFEPFFTTREAGQGAGLGLSTVKSLVEESNGTITLESEPGEGTTCRISFPAREHPVEVAATPDREEITPDGGRTVMVAEDEAMARSVLVRVLRRFGYTVLEASSGREALSVAGEHAEPIDLLIADVIMPRMSGKELAGRFAEKHPETKVLFVSGYSQDVTIRRGMLGADAELLPKPFTPQELLTRVRDLLEDSGPEDPGGEA